MDKPTPPTQNPPKRLRFESELQGDAVEGTTSGQLVPKSTPIKKQKIKLKRRLRFEDETPPLVGGRVLYSSTNEADTGYNAISEKPTAYNTTPSNPKSRLRFEEDAPKESALIQDDSKSRLRFEDEDILDNGTEDLRSTASTPKGLNAAAKSKVQYSNNPPHGLPLLPHRARERLHFDDAATADGLPPTDSTPNTSGQVVPKLKQKSDFQQGDKNSVLSEIVQTDGDSSSMLHDDNTPTFHQDDESPIFKQDSDTPSHGGNSSTSGGVRGLGSIPIGSGTSAPKGKEKSTTGATPTNNTPKAKNKATQAAQSKQTAQDNKSVQKAKQKVDKIEGKLDKAREVLAEQKPYKPPSLIKQFGSFISWRYVHRKIHQKIHEVERENVGTESAHKVELAAEGVVRATSRYVKHRIRTRPKRRVQKLSKKRTKAKANHAYQKLLQDNPELRKKTLARFYHKQRLKMRYAQQAQKAAHGAKHGSGLIAKATAKIKNVAIALVKKNPKVWAIIFLFGLLLMLLQSCMAMFTAIGGGMGGVVGATSYLAEDADIDEATVLYTRLETDLEYQIIHAERDNPDFDEYRFSIGDISHNPLELIAFLTAVYGDFTIAEAQATIQEIFDEQYQLEFTPELEIRTRIEERTGTSWWMDGFGNIHFYTYTYFVAVEYEWRILNVTLTSQSFREVILSRMNEEQTQHFNLLMLTHGNRQYLQSPFNFNWLPYVTSFYGYRIHPINGGIERHWGIDIGLPEGTEILSGQDGTVIFAGDAGGYGLLVVIDNGEGLVSRYAHCSVLLVNVGDVVVAGDLIARVGNTGASTGAHLHLEVIKDGRHLNPLIFTVTNHHLTLPAEADSFVTIAVPLTNNPQAPPLYLTIPIVTNHNPPITTFTAFEANPTTSTPMSDEMFAALIAEAERHLGTPYVFGANGSNAFDCSSYVCWVFTHSGIYHLPRTTAQGIFNQSTPIPPSESQRGDLIFFTGTYSTTRTVTHVGIYTGDGFMIHAGSPVGYANINTPFWQRHFYSFGRLNW